MCRKCCKPKENSCRIIKKACSSIPNRFGAFPENYLYGYAYTPNQQINETFEPSCGLRNGTIFPEIVSPYEPDDSIRFINYLKQGGCQNGM